MTCRSDRPYIESRHRAWLQAFADAKSRLRRPPTVREFACAMGRGTTVAYYRMGVLEDCGFLGALSAAGTARNIDITELGLRALGIGPAPCMAGELDGGGCL